MGGFDTGEEHDAIVVRKIAAVFEVPVCLLGDGCGRDDCATCNPPKPTRRQRLRWWWHDQVSSKRTRLGEWVAGRRFEDEW